MEYVELNEQDADVLRSAIEASDRLYVVRNPRGRGRTAYDNRADLLRHTLRDVHRVCERLWGDCCDLLHGCRGTSRPGHHRAVWRHPDGNRHLLPPCGRCREVISDFNPNAWVIMTTMPDHWDVAAIDRPSKVRVADLLPLKSHGLSHTTA